LDVTTYFMVDRYKRRRRDMLPTYCCTPAKEVSYYCER